jgi:flagellar export protein FliJ
MAFHFSLGALLRLRESLERQELQKLQICAANVARVRTDIESLDAEIEAAQREVFEQTATGISGAELQMAAISDGIRRQTRTSLLAKLAEFELAWKKQQVRFAEARQRREILSNLRQRQLAAYQLEWSRREQQQIDELFLIRRGARASREARD